MNIYLHELRSYRKHTILWVASLCLGTVFLFSMYPAFAGNAATLINLLKNYPAIIQAALGIDVNLIGQVGGFYSFIVTFFSVCGAVQAMMLGLSVLSKETTGKTADFLLTKPVKRSRIVAAKLTAVFTCIAITGVAYIACTAAMASAVATQKLEYKPIFMISLTFCFVQVMFLAMGFLVSAVVPKIRSTVPIALACAFGFFVVGAVAATLEQKALFYLSPFKYFDAPGILATSSYEAPFVIAGALIVAVLIAAAFVIYTRRDIRQA